MRTTWPVLKHLTFGWNAFVTLLLLFVAVLVAAIGNPARPAGVTAALEQLTPLAGIIAFSHVMAVDSEERVLELRFSYPPQRGRLVVERSLPAVGALAATVAAVTLAARACHSPVGIGSALAATLPPAVALLGLCCYTAVLTGSRLIAAIPALLWWGLGLTVTPPGAAGLPAAVQTLTHLYQYSRPLAFVNLPANRTALVLTGLLFLLAAVRALARREP
ncbi:MAG: hypothetical protein ACM3XN_07225 [Chloroflexota bacterium]